MRELYSTLQTYLTKRHSKHVPFRLQNRHIFSTFSSDADWMANIKHSVIRSLVCFISPGTHPEECQVLHLLRGLSLWSLMAGCSQLVFGKQICGTLEMLGFGYKARQLHVLTAPGLNHKHRSWGSPHFYLLCEELKNHRCGCFSTFV